jgi:hypothetical protein
MRTAILQWTDRERDIIRQFYLGEPMPALLKRLPGRSVRQVRKIATQMNLHRRPVRNRADA